MKFPTRKYTQLDLRIEQLMGSVSTNKEANTPWNHHRRPQGSFNFIQNILTWISGYILKNVYKKSK